MTALALSRGSGGARHGTKLGSREPWRDPVFSAGHFLPHVLLPRHLSPYVFTFRFILRSGTSRAVDTLVAIYPRVFTAVHIKDRDYSKVCNNELKDVLNRLGFTLKRNSKGLRFWRAPDHLQAEEGEAPQKGADSPF